MSPDSELVSAYAVKGSETAFRALVQRHVDLVFSTAMRQVGDAGMAEEITQNVFIALARKSPRLGGVETLAGWLYRTTILESKARVRSEIRRRQREDRAVEMAVLAPEGESPLEALVPLLDEALLNLRETDRMALILRFMEERSLRDVGVALGVDEDAARKRVSRALGRVAEFFRCRGFATAGVGAIAVFAHTAKAAPAGLAMSAANAGLAVKGAAGGVGAFLFHLMALTKIQTATLCVAVAAVPLAIQWRADARLAADLAGIDARIHSQNQALADLTSQSDKLRDDLFKTRTDAVNSQYRMTALDNLRQGKTPASVYHWDDKATLVRVPKKLLHQLNIPAMTQSRGQLTDQIKQTLQLSEAESERAQSALNKLLSDFDSAQAKTIKRVDPNPNELNGEKAEDVRVFEVSSVGTQFDDMKKAFRDEVNSTLGEERSGLFLSSIESVVPLDPPESMMSSSWAVLNKDFRLTLRRVPGSDDAIQVGISTPNSSMNYGMSADYLPPSWRNEIPEWLTPTSTQEEQ